MRWSTSLCLFLLPGVQAEAGDISQWQKLRGMGAFSKGQDLAGGPYGRWPRKTTSPR